MVLTIKKIASDHHGNSQRCGGCALYAQQWHWCPVDNCAEAAEGRAQAGAAAAVSPGGTWHHAWHSGAVQKCWLHASCTATSLSFNAPGSGAYREQGVGCSPLFLGSGMAPLHWAWDSVSDNADMTA